MFELKIPRDELEDLAKKMSLPTGKDEFVFETIAPTITPEGRLEWIGKTKNITAWIRAKDLSVSGITEPIILPFKAAALINTLAFFQKDDLITLVHDKSRGEDIFTTNSEVRKRTVKLPSIVETEAKEKQDVFPGQIGEDGVIVYKAGRKPNLHCSCDVSVFKELVANTNQVMGNKKKEEIPNIFHITFDEANGMLRTVAGESTDRAHQTVDDEIHTLALAGNGTVHFAMGFPDVMGVLSEIVELYALQGGPLWVVQDDVARKRKLRYLIPPAKVDRD
jgi:hypothetical protein